MWWPLWPRLVEETGKGGIRCHRLFMVHWFQLCLAQWSQALFGLLVAGLFSVMISKAHLKSHRRNSESMQPDVVTSALLQAHCSSVSTLRQPPVARRVSGKHMYVYKQINTCVYIYIYISRLKSIRERCEREKEGECAARASSTQSNDRSCVPRATASPYNGSRARVKRSRAETVAERGEVGRSRAI